MNAKNDYIAVFDSGLGGLTVLRELLRLMPNERYLYFGDAANAPYGSHSTQEVREFTLNCTRELMAQEVKALVVACNTATSAAIDTLRRQYPDTIIIGIEPALKVAVDRFPGGNIAVMATPVTLREEKFRKLMNRYAQNCKVTPIPAPGLVELIETGHIDDPETDRYLSALLGDFRGKLDAVVLGCTHYPFAAGAISRILGTGTVLVPWSVVSFLQGDTPRALGILGIYITAALTRSMLEPKLLGQHLGLDPLVTLIALYIGYRLWGVGGMLLAPVLTVTVLQLRREKPEQSQGR